LQKQVLNGGSKRCTETIFNYINQIANPNDLLQAGLILGLVYLSQVEIRMVLKGILLMKF